MKFVNTVVGYEYDGGAKGKCTKRNGVSTPAVCTCWDYAPNLVAERFYNTTER